MDQTQPGIGLKQRQRHYCHWGGWSGVTISDCAFAMCGLRGACAWDFLGTKETTETTETQRKMIPDFVVVSLVSPISSHS